MSVVLHECGCCGSYHLPGYGGDCREDSQRYEGAEDYAERHGVAVDTIEEISVEDQTEDTLLEYLQVCGVQRAGHCNGR